MHANALLTGSGTTTIMLADLGDPRAILANPAMRAVLIRPKSDQRMEGPTLCRFLTPRFPASLI